MKAHLLAAFAAISFLCSTTTQAQTTYVVDQDGSGDFGAIQECIDAASSHDICRVNEGTYEENINFSGKNITLVSSSGPETTIIDGQEAGTVVTFESGESGDAILSGFTIQNGFTATHGGGVYCGNSSSPTIANCIIRDNYAWDTGNPYGTNNGGGIYCGDSSSPMITNCVVSDNFAWRDGGGIYCVESSPEISDCLVISNTAYTECRGGGIACYNSSPLITNSTIRDNRAENFGVGGGIYCHESSPTITHCEISGNYAGDGGGGGISCFERSSPTISYCTINNNYVDGNYSGVDARFDSSPIITHCTISENRGSHGTGFSHSSATITHTRISGNDYTGIASSASSLTITNCLISENGTGAVGLSDSSSLTITNSTIHGHSLDYDYDVISCHHSSAVISNCILWGNTAERGSMISLGAWPWRSSLTVTYSNIEGGESLVDVDQGSTLVWGEGNIDQDPLFASGPLDGRYLSQVSAGQAVDSPCIDAGDPATEFWGWNVTTTRTDELPDTGIMDMGYHYSSSLCTDNDEDTYAAEGGVCGEADCDDTDPNVHPGAMEVCDGVDNNCLDGIDEEPAASDSCDNSRYCDGQEGCDAGSCQAGAIPCPDDGAYCNGSESCDETDDRCLHSGDPCPDDGLFCNGAESCYEAGDQCVHSGNPCGDDALLCNGVEVCDEQGDQCLHSGDPCPDDGVFCNGTESCDELGDQCLHSGNPCPDDGEFCNGTESCDELGDQCLHSGNPCPDDSQWCNGEEACNEDNDQCEEERVPDCDDQNDCTDDSCDEASDRCEHTCGADGAEDPCCIEEVCVHELVCAGADSDDDGIPNGLDPCPLDADCDDDGLTDGHSGPEDTNLNGVVDVGETDPTKFDTDGDGLSDGVERGLTVPERPNDTDLSIFLADEDPSSTTDPTNPDTDGDGVPDGVEDANGNGRVDKGETDPNDGNTGIVREVERGGCDCSTNPSSSRVGFRMLMATGLIYSLPVWHVLIMIRRVRKKP